MTTRSDLVAKKVSFPPQNDDEKGCRRQKIAFSVSKRRRERVSSPKSGDSGAKTTTRRGVVAKKGSFPAQKRRRERVSSPKKEVSGAKTTTRKGVVAKKWSFPPQNDDENGSRHQKRKFSATKRRRERVSSPKSGVFRLKTTTRKSLVAKKWSFPPKSDDEKRSRRQKMEFFAQK
ncbi:hypothetical protein [Caldifermentibacillus hisashii]|uniref:hypothetical protein n=1 Tax=Caldifermentibacillus hisashii TaxID=996558 RepID=UPI00310168E4